MSHSLYVDWVYAEVVLHDFCSFLLQFLIFVGGVIVYFAPIIVAKQERKKKNTNAIALVNLLLGWTIVGWLVAIVWATSPEKKQ